MVYQNMVVESPNGMQPYTVVEADFVLPAACDGKPI